MFLAWDPADQDKALAWQADENDRCPGCHTPWDTATDKALSDQWEADPVKCHVCAERRREEIRWSDKTDVERAGLFIPVVRKGTTRPG